MTTAASDTVSYEVRDHVLVIRIEREEKRNAIDPETTRGLDRSMALLEADPELWVGVLTGGPRMFSAGTDLSYGASPATEQGGEYGVIRRRRRRPLIAAVEGIALGGGFELVLACDLAVAGSSARFGLPEPRRGLVAGSGGIVRVGAALPRAVAMEVLLAGGTLDAATAQAYGLVNRVVPDGQALEGALELADAVCLGSPFAVEQTLLAVREQRLAEEAVGWEASDRAVAAVGRSADMAEGIAAFFERRPPRWTGA
jgi:enoyl-CoA hydratase